MYSVLNKFSPGMFYYSVFVVTVHMINFSFVYTTFLTAFTQFMGTYFSFSLDYGSLFFLFLEMQRTKHFSERRGPDSIYHKIYPTSENVPKCYGLPKIHKKDSPLRPIESLDWKYIVQDGQVLGGDTEPCDR